MTPRVSVVIPCYNHARWVREAVRSALDQSVADLEVIVVDDGSKDDSVAVVRAIADPRLRVIVQENQGTHRALDRGLREARGTCLAILNSDDRYAPGRLEAALAVLDAAPEVALVGSWIQVIDAEGRPVAVKEGWANLDPWPVPDPERTFKADGDPRTALLMQNYWATTSNYVLPRETYQRFGPFRPLRYAHDWDFALRVQRERKARLIPRPLLDYRIHESNTIRSDRAAMVYEVCWVMAVHLPLYLEEAWFWETGAARRAEQLLRSIHVYGCESVLLAMMAEIHQGPAGSESRLLDPNDPSRRLYLEEVRRVLDREGAARDAEPADPARAAGRLRSLLRRLAR